MLKGIAKTLGVCLALPGAVAKLEAGRDEFMHLSLKTILCAHRTTLNTNETTSNFSVSICPSSSSFNCKKTRAKIRSTPGAVLLKFAVRTLGPVNMKKQFGFQTQSNPLGAPALVCL